MDKKFKFVGDPDWYEYMALIKWPDETFECKKCKYTKYCIGKKPFQRRCVKCRYDESPTVGTMFDKCKFSLLIAFYIAFKITSKKKGMSSLELSREFELRQPTYWEFKWKIQQAIQGNVLS